MSNEPRGRTDGNTASQPPRGVRLAEVSTEHVYYGRREPTAPVGEECTVRVDGEPLATRYDLLSASPTGFEWGYGGSGPAQLAIAILAHAYGDDVAVAHYQRFVREKISKLAKNEWALTTRDLDSWLEEVQADA